MRVALTTIFDEFQYVDDALKKPLPANLKERFTTKRDQLKRVDDLVQRTRNIALRKRVKFIN